MKRVIGGQTSFAPRLMLGTPDLVFSREEKKKENQDFFVSIGPNRPLFAFTVPTDVDVVSTDYDEDSGEFFVSLKRIGDQNQKKKKKVTEQFELSASPNILFGCSGCVNLTYGGCIDCTTFPLPELMAMK